MEYYCTTCCADKDPAPGLLPVLERYRDTRLAAVAARARAADRPLLILSGRFGLLTEDDRIPWYDQALSAAEAPRLARRLAAQLGALGATGIVFWALPPQTPGWAPYHAALAEAARLAGAALEFRNLAAE